MKKIKSQEKDLVRRLVRRSLGEGGFTLIEILVVIGIIAILALIVLVAINPARQFALGRNSQRTANVEAILNAVGQKMVDNKGSFFTVSSGTCINDIPSEAVSTTTAVRIEAAGTAGFSTTNDYDIAGCITPTYIPALPFDPSTTTPQSAFYTDSTHYDTGYYIYRDVNGRVGICAPTLEAAVGTSEICVTR
jgi:type IV pilus assembly protein PilA